MKNKRFAMVCLDELVSKDQPYRCFKSLLPMAFLSPLLESLNKPLGRYGSERLFFYCFNLWKISTTEN